jgi:hypothetical protein
MLILHAEIWETVPFQLTEVVVIILTVNRSHARYLGVVHSISAGYYTLNVATYIGLYLYFLCSVVYTVSILTKQFNNKYIFMLLLINFGLSD